MKSLDSLSGKALTFETPPLKSLDSLSGKALTFETPPLDEKPVYPVKR
jgi:hypothetical protein